MRAQATGYGSSPSFAKLVVDAQFLELLLRLKDLSERERLTEVRVSGGLNSGAAYPISTTCSCNAQNWS